MIIRPYTPADEPACIAAFKSNMPRFFAVEELEDYTRWLRKIDSGESYYVVEKEGTVVACGGYYIEPEKQEAGMAWGMVHNAFHRLGIGRQLLLYRIEKIRAACPRCRILLDTTQHSCPFFRKLGFSVVKVTKDSYGPGLDRYDMELLPAANDEQ